MKPCFMLMPFQDNDAEDIYRLCTKPTIFKLGLDIRRSDELFTTNPILEDILESINESLVVIADVSGLNPNVLYELGISHTIKKEQTIIITHENYNKLPFDIKPFRSIKYKNTVPGGEKYKKELEETVKYILRDYKTIYKDEFELLIKTLVHADIKYIFYFLIALKNIIKKPLNINYKKFHIEGCFSENPKYRDDYTNESLTTKTISLILEPTGNPIILSFINLNYLKIIGNLLYLTEKGKSFSEFLQERGFTCTKFEYK